MSRFVLLDRDGTLTHDAGYTHRVEDYALLPGVLEGLTRLAAGGFRFAVVTNQSGIGRGYYTLSDYQAFQAHLTRDLARQGIALEASFVCPHRPDEGCACRKPEPGLLRRASDELGFALAESWMVGNGVGDVLAGCRAGCAGSIWIGSGLPPGELPAHVPRCADLREAADVILSQEPV